MALTRLHFSPESLRGVYCIAEEFHFSGAVTCCGSSCVSWSLIHGSSTLSCVASTIITSSLVLVPGFKFVAEILPHVSEF
uniref:Uncharacterized protein n=1 Tax=Physcomitrium patens TaxID=3218 RepID=A0A2K1J9X9_PHYPA|nr:hypothetical protein PHYPA_021442 [Physcomitrium patens]